MIETMNLGWFLAGILVGLLHATMLWRSTKQPTAWTPVSGMLRLGMVAGVLVVAALSNAILIAAGGWLAGFVARCAWFILDRTNHEAPSSEAHSGE